MATGGVSFDDNVWTEQFIENIQEQRNEVLALESMYDIDDRIQVTTEASEDVSSDPETNPKLYSMTFTIPVNSEADQIHLDVLMPSKSSDDGELVPVSDVDDINIRTQLASNCIIGSITVSYLAPIYLDVVLPPEYPSSRAPDFKLGCIWLSGQQLGILCKKLDELWEENHGMPVLYTWIDWLENNCFSELKITDHIEVLFMKSMHDEDKRARPMFFDIDKSVTSLMRYNLLMETGQFRKGEHECSICLQDLPGTEFYRLDQCKHFICCSCMRDHCGFHVQEGTVLELKCPYHECDMDIPPFIIKEVLSEKEYERWEKLSLEKGLVRMGDVVWCPRCKAAVIKDSDRQLHLGHCTTCYFSFCTKCYNPWHQGVLCMSPEEELELFKSKMREKLKQEIEDEALREEELKKALERQQKEESFSEAYINEYTKFCPVCERKIEKDGGCNKVTCSICRHSMCWACSKDITKESYAHFTNNPKCSTFVYEPQRHELNKTINKNYDDYWNAVMPAKDNTEQKSLEYMSARTVGKLAVRCPVCKLHNLQGDDGNNHIKCWNCNCNFCYLCRCVITGSITKHFALPSPCKQHTATHKT